MHGHMNAEFYVIHCALCRDNFHVRCAQIRETKFCTVAHSSFSVTVTLFVTLQNVYKFTWTKQKAPDSSEVQGSLHNYGS